MSTSRRIKAKWIIIPQAAAGLINAVFDEDSSALLSWQKQEQLRLIETLRWQVPKWVAIAIAESIVDAALDAKLKGTSISSSDEIAWMAGVASRQYAYILRSRHDAKKLSDSELAAIEQNAIPVLGQVERNEQLRVLVECIERLDDPYKTAFSLLAEGSPFSEASKSVELQFAVGPSRARKIVYESIKKAKKLVFRIQDGTF